MLVSGVPKFAKSIVRGSAVALFERFRLICSLLLAAIMPSTCNTPACGGKRENISCSSPSEERTLRHHAAGIQVAPSSPLQRLTMQHPCRLPVAVTLRPVFHSHLSFSRTGTRTKAEAPSRPPSRSMPTCRLRILFAASGVTHAAGTPLHTRSCAWRSSSWPIGPLETFCNPEFAVIAAGTNSVKMVVFLWMVPLC
jgi:hypothetical protein